jgi:ABC-type antimicrobial peptide transport system permease subunit
LRTNALSRSLREVSVCCHWCCQHWYLWNDGAYAVNTRTGKIGLRIALGARASQVLSRVLREAFWVTGAGIVLGLIAVLWLTRFIRVMLYGLAGTDALTVGGTAALLIAVSLLAAFAPARRASRIDPIRALRHD